MPARSRALAGVGLVALVGLLAPGGLPVAERACSAAAPSAAGDRPWSFAPIKKPALPKVTQEAWARDDLDRFILAKLEAAGHRPNPDADRATLLRRLCFDLTGLPPTDAQLTAFLADRGGDDAALARAVDALLASPRFGERWARHWLDVVRYADSTGRTWNTPLTYAFRYRDYVIDALNADKPYDRFLTEQLAGDLLPAKTLDERRANLTALGMLALGAHDLQTLSGEQFDLDVVDDQVDVVSRAMLGLTVSCARCHDHKYDPVKMRDYYALAGIFYSTELLPGTSYRGAGNGYLDHERLVLLPVLDRGRMVTPRLTPGTHSMRDYQELWSGAGQRDIRYSTDPNLAMSAREGQLSDCAIRIKGDPYDRGDVPPRGDVRIAGLPPMTRPGPQTSGRLELARWITSPRNPLTARVMVNRVWLHLFGAGLVSTPDDFGAVSETPTHPELLDHLSTRFRDDGWSVKRLIRALVLSRTYRQSSQTRDNPAQTVDPQNTLYWRAHFRRLEFEPLRDALLAVAGRLTTDRPEGVQVAGIGGKSSKSQARGLLGLDDPYRTVYLPVIRSRLDESYSMFDFPDPCQIAGRRDVTTVAPQALFFLNSRFVTDCAAETVERLAEANLPSDAARVAWLYRRLLGRPPTTMETNEALALVRDLGTSGEAGSDLAGRWTTLVQGLLAGAEFRYVR